jgi:hypothetical protein
VLLCLSWPLTFFFFPGVAFSVQFPEHAQSSYVLPKNPLLSLNYKDPKVQNSKELLNIEANPILPLSFLLWEQMMVLSSIILLNIIGGMSDQDVGKFKQGNNPYFLILFL